MEDVTKLHTFTSEVSVCMCSVVRHSQHCPEYHFHYSLERSLGGPDSLSGHDGRDERHAKVIEVIRN